MDPVTLGLIGAAAITAVAGIWGAATQSNAADRAGKIQAEENRRVQAMNIRFAKEESEREMFRFKEGQRESGRQFNLSASQRRKETVQQESQFARTHELEKERVGLDKTKLLYENRQAMRNNIQNLFAQNHNLRMGFANYYQRRA